MVDTRTATEYSFVRTFGQAGSQLTTLGASTFNLNPEIEGRAVQCARPIRTSRFRR